MAVWLENLESMMERRTSLLLPGNVRDWYFDERTKRLHENLTSLLTEVARDWGHLSFAQRIVYDAVGGERRLDLLVGSEAGAPLAVPVPGEASTPVTSPSTTSQFRVPASRVFAALRRELTPSTPSRLVIVNYLDKIVGYQPIYQDPEAETLLWLEKLLENVGENHRVFLVALRETMVPVELYTNAPMTSVMPVPLPDKGNRMAYLAYRLGSSFPHSELVADLAEGLFLRDLENITTEVRSQSDAMGERDVRRLVNRYRLGNPKDYWSGLDLRKLDGAEETLRNVEGVHGQDRAVHKVVDMLRLARAGLAGQAGGTASKPKGVLFFAGPSGVGKTLLAKKLAKFLFGSEEAFLRFDMSEMKEEHTVSKLIGSPPGYVGSERGGVLTNAVRAKPFSVILFDEIEKAHPKIMDLFLQILDDGRLTDSLGQTVFFTESVIIFTTNLGTRTADSRGLPVGEKDELDQLRADRELDEAGRRERVAEHFVRVVEHYFYSEISRPELLNRIGRNIVPFNYIDVTADQVRIIQAHLERFEAEFNDQHRAAGHRLEHHAEVLERLVAKHGQRISEFGGRGIVHTLEEELMRPLSLAVLASEYRGLRNGVFTMALAAADSGGPDGFVVEVASTDARGESSVETFR